MLFTVGVCRWGPNPVPEITCHCSRSPWSTWEQGSEVSCAVSHLEAGPTCDKGARLTWRVWGEAVSQLPERRAWALEEASGLGLAAHPA